MNSFVGWVEPFAKHIALASTEVMGFAALNPSFELRLGMKLERTRTPMEFAIFALAIVGPAVMGAGGVFAAWHKTAGLWIGFFGAIVLLLSLALYLQNDINRQISQPIINLKPPEERWIIRLETGQVTPFTRLQDRAPDIGFGTLPTLQLVNASPVNALDATIKWQFAGFDYQGLIANSPRMRNWNLEYKDNLVIIGRTGSGAVGMQIATSSSYPINYITRKADAYVPGTVWTYAALFIMATLPEEPGGKTSPISFDVTLDWNIPAGSAPRHFRVRVTATNAKLPSVPTPDLLATLDFEVDDLDAPK